MFLLNIDDPLSCTVGLDQSDPYEIDITTIPAPLTLTDFTFTLSSTPVLS